MNKGPALEYASVLARGAAYILDSGIAFLFFAATQQFLFAPLRDRLGEEWFYSGINTELYVLSTVSIFVWLYFALMERSSWRGTIGKRLMKIEIIPLQEGAKLSFGSSFLRTIIKLLPWEVAHLANNLPTPMWYDPNPEFRIGFLISAFLLLAYVGTIFRTPRHQTIHDLLAKTVVVKRQ